MRPASRDGRTSYGRATGLLCVTVLASVLPVFALGGDRMEPDLGGLLPERSDLRGWTPDGPAQQAIGEELFGVINGAAEIFLAAGFSRGLIQSYSGSDRDTLQIEIYEMKSPEAARIVFSRKTQGDGRAIPLGTQGVQGEYYLVFWQDRFLVTLTSTAASPDGMADLLALSRVVERGIGQFQFHRSTGGDQ